MDYVNGLIPINIGAHKGTVIAKTVEGGINQLYRNLPIQLASRSLANYNSLTPGKSCADYMTIANLDQQKL